MTNTKNQTYLEQVLSVISAGLIVHSQDSSVSLDALDDQISFKIKRLTENTFDIRKTQIEIEDQKSTMQNIINLISSIQNQVASLPPVSAVPVSYALGSNRIPQVFYAPKNLTQEQIEDLAIRTEQVIEKDIYCQAPDQYIESLWHDEFSFDLWANLGEDWTEKEIFQYFFVSKWLGEILSNIGEIVYTDDHCSIWGRQVFGQSIVLDCTIQKALSVAFGYETYQKDDEDESEDDEDDELED
jgi:hypothetical protein